MDILTAKSHKVFTIITEFITSLRRGLNFLVVFLFMDMGLFLFVDMGLFLFMDMGLFLFVDMGLFLFVDMGLFLFMDMCLFFMDMCLFLWILLKLRFKIKFKIWSVWVKIMNFL